MPDTPSSYYLRIHGAHSRGALIVSQWVHDINSSRGAFAPASQQGMIVTVRVATNAARFHSGERPVFS